MLILFDIDGTLLLTKGAGIAAMVDAGRHLFGDAFTNDGVEFAGRLDPQIWSDLARRNRIADPTAHHDRFRAAYHRFLTNRLSREPTCSSLPGVSELLEELSRRGECTLGLLTGNYPETGRTKITFAGLDPECFVVSAWGCDAQTRRDLVLIALDKLRDLNGITLRPQDAVIVGDTPHDVDCAKAHGCRALGVATGPYRIHTLREAGADLALETLADTSFIMNWLRESPKTISR